MNNKGAIGIFDSGYGGLTIFKEIAEKLPHYSYVYLGDNARSPYGDYPFDTVYEYTLACVEWLFNQGCPLVIVACNTASAKALSNIQILHLPEKHPNSRVLGVIRPTAEVIGEMSNSKSIGVLATRGTVNSESYLQEINNFWPDVAVYQQSCPMWAPLIESGILDGDEIDFFIKEYLDALMLQSNEIDTVLLACTHYPLLISKIESYLPAGIKIVSQGSIIARSLADYLKRNPDINVQLSRTESEVFYTTGDADMFSQQASVFLGKKIIASKVEL